MNMSWKFLIKSLLALTTCWTAVIVAASPAGASPEAPITLTCALTDGQTRVVCDATNLTPGITYTVTLRGKDGPVVLGTFVAPGDGTKHLDMPRPDGITGVRDIDLTGGGESATTTADFEPTLGVAGESAHRGAGGNAPSSRRSAPIVTSTTQVLSSTGFAVIGVTGGALIMLSAGALLLRFGRRRDGVA